MYPLQVGSSSSSSTRHRQSAVSPAHTSCLRLLCADMLVACGFLSLSLQGWQHVGDRLISATVEYEETGWYDGQVGMLDPVCLLC